MAASIQPVVMPKGQGANPALWALLHSAGFAALEDIGWIRVTGSDRVRWLNGMVTNSIQSLKPGEGCYNFVLNAQGQIQGDLNVFAPGSDPNALLLHTTRAHLPAVLAHLDHFIIMDDVELTDISNQRAGVLVAGPQAEATLAGLGIAPAPRQEMTLESTKYGGAELEIIHAHSPLIPRFELWTDPATITEISSKLSAGDVVPAPAVAIEQLRILEGTPRYGVDIRSRDLPQETAQTRALHFNKGCYLGQEIVERIRSRGNVHRTFTGFELSGQLPAPGAQLTVEGKPIGELTSIAATPLAESKSIQLALGYIRREALERKLPIEYAGGTAAPLTLPYSMP